MHVYVNISILIVAGLSLMRATTNIGNEQFKFFKWTHHLFEIAEKYESYMWNAFKLDYISSLPSFVVSVKFYYVITVSHNYIAINKHHDLTIFLQFFLCCYNL